MSESDSERQTSDTHSEQTSDPHSEQTSDPQSSAFCVGSCGSCYILQNGTDVIYPGLEEVLIWNIEKNAAVTCFVGESAKVTAFALSTDETVIAVGYANGVISNWKVKSGRSTKPIASFSIHHNNAVSCLEFAATKLSLVSGGSDGSVIVSSEDSLIRLHGHVDKITHCVFAKADEFVISSSKDGSVKFWNLALHECVSTLHLYDEYYSSSVYFALLHGEKRLVTGSQNTVSLFDLEIDYTSLKQPSLKKEKRNRSVCLPNLEGVSRDTVVRCVLMKSLDLPAPEKIQSMIAHSDAYGACLLIWLGSCVDTFLLRFCDAPKPKFERVATRSVSKSPLTVPPPLNTFIKGECIEYQSLIRGVHLQKTKLRQTLEALLVLSDYSLVWYKVTVTNNKINFANEQLLGSSIPAHSNLVRAIVLSNDDSYIASGSSGELRVWRRSNPEKCIFSKAGIDVLSLAFFPTSVPYILVGTKGGYVGVYCPANGAIKAFHKSIQLHSTTILSMDMHDSVLVTADAHGAVKLWKVFNITISSRPTNSILFASPVVCVKFSPNLEFLTVSVDSLGEPFVQIVNLPECSMATRLYGYTAAIVCMDISLDNEFLVTGSNDSHIRIWKMGTWDCLKSIATARNHIVRTLQFHPDSQHFYSGADGGEIHCWSTDTFKCVSTLKKQTNEVSALAISHDGLSLVTGSRDQSMRLWDLQPQQQQVCSQPEIESQLAKVDNCQDDQTLQGVLDVLCKLSQQEVQESVLHLDFKQVMNWLILLEYAVKKKKATDFCINCLFVLLHHVHHHQGVAINDTTLFKGQRNIQTTHLLLIETIEEAARLILRITDLWKKFASLAAQGNTE